MTAPRGSLAMRQASRRRRLLATVAGAWMAACRPQAPVVVPLQPEAGAVTQLRQTITALLSDPVVARGTWGVVATSLEREETLYATNPHKLLIPASALKVVTLAVAAQRLGWDFSYETRLMTTGTVESGVLNADLVVVGSGDPTVEDWAGTARLFQDWATALKARGIQTINGRIIGDDNAFEDQSLGAGWAWDDLGAAYATGVGGLQFNQNAARISISPGPAVGTPATVALITGAAPLSLQNLVSTSSPGTRLSLQILPMPRSQTLELRGSIPADSVPVQRNTSVANPTLYFVTALRNALLEGGIQVSGPAVDIDDITDAPAIGHATTIAITASEPLARLGATMAKLSQNLFAETLLKTLGRSDSSPGSIESGRQIVRSTLDEWNISAGDVLMVDGSGLSRYNLVTADALVKVLAHVHDSEELRDGFASALPCAGVDGTLAERMKGTPAERNACAKTGSFSNVRSLAGYVRTADGEPLAFAILANNFGVEPEAVDRTADAIVAALARFTRR